MTSSEDEDRIDLTQFNDNNNITAGDNELRSVMQEHLYPCFGNDTIDTNLHALWTDETLPLLDAELLFSDITTSDSENNGDSADNLTKEIIDSVKGSQDTENGIDNYISGTVVASENTEVSIYDTDDWIEETTVSFEAPDHFDMKPSETTVQQDNRILGDNYLFEIRCTHCGNLLSVPQSMNHLCEKRMKPRKTFACIKCSQTFYNQIDLIHHKKTTHFTCSICKRNLAGKFSLTRHYRLVHGKANIQLS